MKHQERDGIFAERRRAILSTNGEPGCPVSESSHDCRRRPSASTGLDAGERSLTRYVGDLDSGLGRAAVALFRSVAPLLVGLHLAPESIRTCAEVHQ